jgi:hypothetical protein
MRIISRWGRLGFTSSPQFNLSNILSHLNVRRWGGLLVAHLRVQILRLPCSQVGCHLWDGTASRAVLWWGQKYKITKNIYQGNKFLPNNLFSVKIWYYLIHHRKTIQITSFTVSSEKTHNFILFIIPATMQIKLTHVPCNPIHYCIP